MKLSLSRREIRRLRHEARMQLAEARKRLVRGMLPVTNPETVWERLVRGLSAAINAENARRRMESERAHRGPDRCHDCSGMGRGEDEAGEWICSSCWGVGAIRGAA